MEFQFDFGMMFGECFFVIFGNVGVFQSFYCGIDLGNQRFFWIDVFDFDVGLFEVGIVICVGVGSIFMLIVGCEYVDFGGDIDFSVYQFVGEYLSCCLVEIDGQVVVVIVVFEVDVQVWSFVIIDIVFDDVSVGECV